MILSSNFIGADLRSSVVKLFAFIRGWLQVDSKKRVP